MWRLLAILFYAGIVGMLQGLIVPLLSLLLEKRGVSALFNGVSTTSMYLGVILAAPFIERLVRRLGSKRTVQVSACCCILITIAFPLWPNLYAWMVLRLLLGIGLSGLFVGTEIWLNRILTASNRARGFAFYGMFITIGMIVGPQGINLLTISTAAPFFISAACYMLPLVISGCVSDGDSRLEPLPEGAERGLSRWRRIFLLAPFAMCAAFVFGYLDGALNGEFPVYGSRIGMDMRMISLALTSFMVGSLVFQFPLGYLSDRWGRRAALILATSIGCLNFLLLPLSAHAAWMLLSVLFLAGGALGSFYSLGMAYLGDRLPRADLPTGNVLYTMLYGIGSLLGPAVTGGMISWLEQDAFAWSIAGMLIWYISFGLFDKRAFYRAPFIDKTRGV